MKGEEMPLERRGGKGSGGGEDKEKDKKRGV